MKTAEMYHKILRKIVQKGCYTAQQIYNADETRLFWKGIPNRIYILKDERVIPGLKAAEDKLKLLLGVKADGGRKLKPYLVYHSQNPRTLKSNKGYPFSLLLVRS
jgi:hypothetical protein